MPLPSEGSGKDPKAAPLNVGPECKPHGQGSLAQEGQSIEDATAAAAGTDAPSIDELVEGLRESTDIEFIRRETRLIPVLMNLWLYFRPFGAEHRSPRSKAAVSAFLWRLFSPGTAAAATGGTLVVFLGIAQLVLIEQQNAKLDQQTHIMQSQTNVALLAQMGEVMEQMLEYAEKACLSEATAKAFGKAWSHGIDLAALGVQTERVAGPLPQCWIDVAAEDRELWVVACSSEEACHSRASKAFAGFRSLRERQELGFTTGAEDALVLPASLTARVVSLSRSARPYRFLDPSPQEGAETSHKRGWLNGWKEWLFGLSEDGSPKLISRPLSAERGALLARLFELGLRPNPQIGYPDFTAAYVPRLHAVGKDISFRFSNAYLPNALFIGKSLGLTLFYKTDAPSSNFAGADLSAVYVLGGDFSCSNFEKAKLPDALRFRPADLSGASIIGAIVKEADFLDKLATQETKGFDRALFELAENKSARGTFSIVPHQRLGKEQRIAPCSSRNLPLD